MNRTFALLIAACVIGFAAPAWALDDDDEAAAAKERAARQRADAEKKAAKDDSKKPAATDDKPADDAKKDNRNPFANPDGGPPPESNPVTPPKESSGIKLPGDKPKTPPPPKSPPPPPAAQKDALPDSPNATDALCPLCKGTGFLPNSPYKPYIKFEGQPAPNPDYTPAYKYCTKCQAGMDIKTISEDMKARQQSARDKHATFEEQVGKKKLVQFETPFITCRSMLSAADNKKIADALEKCAGILQDKSKTLVLVCTRPASDALICVADVKTYDTYLEHAIPANEQDQLALAKKCGAFTWLHVSLEKMIMPGPPYEDRAVFSWAGMLMRNLTNEKAKHWLSEGFSAYCENATLGNNLIYRVVYDFHDIKFGKNWNEDVKKNAAKLKPWPEIFQLNLENMKPLEYEMCYSVVSFLIKSDAAKFDKFVLNIGAGDENEEALEKAYGKKIKDLQAEWGKWILSQK